MAATITDKLYTASGAPRNGLTVYGYPVDNTIRVGATLRPIQPDISIQLAAYQYGVSALSATDGDYSLVLPDATQQAPTGSRWRIALPDGKVLEGVPPAAGTYTIAELLTTHSWTYVAGQSVVAESDGRVAAGEIVLSGQDYYDVVFATPLEASTYTVNVGMQSDQTSGGSGGAPGWSFTNRSQVGVRIQLTQAFTGTLTYRCEVE